MSATEQQQEWLDSLHELYSFLVLHPDLVPAYSVVQVNDWIYSSIGPEYGTKEDGSIDYENVANAAEIEADTKRRFADKARSLGACEKRSDEHTFDLVKKFGPHRIIIQASRDRVCERKVVGTEIKEVIDYNNAPRVMKEVEIVEWSCPESILNPNV